MKEQQYDLAVYIGRFQPPHLGHINTIQQALKISSKVLILVGSAYSARCHKNPFSYDERHRMLGLNFPFEWSQEKSLLIEPIIDTLYNENSWIAQVRFKAIEALSGNTQNKKIALMGYSKDESSYYLKNFPDWEFVESEPTRTSSGEILNATDIRNAFYLEEPVEPNLVPVDPMQHISSDCFNRIKTDLEYIKQYKKTWESAPFPPTFNCSDSVVIQSGHVLMIQRGQHPGHGQYALPGGFIDPDESALQGAIRELREETRLKVPEKVLNGSIFAQHVFDHPSRSTRGRTFSHAFGFKLDDSLPLPEVRGGDDAAKAMWVPFEVMSQVTFREKIFEDHASIIDWFLARI